MIEGNDHLINLIENNSVFVHSSFFHYIDSNAENVMDRSSYSIYLIIQQMINEMKKFETFFLNLKFKFKIKIRKQFQNIKNLLNFLDF